MDSIDALSRSCCRERGLNNSGIVVSYDPEVRTFNSPHDSSLYVGGQDTLAEPTNEETASFMRSGTRSGGGISHPEIPFQ